MEHAPDRAGLGPTDRNTCAESRVRALLTEAPDRPRGSIHVIQFLGAHVRVTPKVGQVSFIPAANARSAFADSETPQPMTKPRRWMDMADIDPGWYPHPNYPDTTELWPLAWDNMV